MNSAGLVGCLLTAVGAASGSAESSTSTASAQNERTIEILVAGPEDARNQMLATIQPLLATTPNLRWVTQASLPPEDTVPASSEGGAAHIWIDVSDLTHLRVYLPETANGAPVVRTLASAGSGAEDVDPMAREAVAQIVKASVLALRDMRPEAGEAGPADVVDASPVSSPVSAPQAPDAHHGLYLRMQSGLGYLRTSESYRGGTDVFSGVGATLQTAVGEAFIGHLILHGEVVMTAVRNANWTDNGGPLSNSGFITGGQDLTLLGVGPGVTYYLPSNFYAAGSLLLSKLWFLDANTNDPVPDADWGIGASVAVGKEWPLGRDWGIGVAVQFNDAVMSHPLIAHYIKSPEPISPSVNVANFALLMSATYN